MNMNEADLRTHLDTNHGYTAVVFSATWCGPCRAFAKILQEHTQTAPNGSPRVVKLDIDECTQLCEDVAINVVPTVVVFKGSKIVARNEGGFPTAKLFAEFLANSTAK